MEFFKSIPKIFWKGHYKTKTTSLKAVLRGFEFNIGSQPNAEFTLGKWNRKDFNSNIEYCQSVQEFRDVTIYLRETYLHLVAYFEGRFDNQLVIYVPISSDYSKLCTFLNKPISKENFPWENKSYYV